MKNISLRDRRKTASEVAAEFREASDKQILNRTVRARLVEAGLKGCKARKKPHLSEVNRKNCVGKRALGLDWRLGEGSLV